MAIATTIGYNKRQESFQGGEGGGTGPIINPSYSQELIAYIGRTELDANFQDSNQSKYLKFKQAIEGLSSSGLCSTDQRLAKIILEQRVRETNPSSSKRDHRTLIEMIGPDESG